MLEFLFELAFEFFGELILQLGFEWLSLGTRAGLAKVSGKSRPRLGDSTFVREATWSIVTGGIAGAITLALFPRLLIVSHTLQMLNVLLAPVAAGLLVERVRSLREGRGFQGEFHFPVFGYAALFGLTFAITRYLFAA
jgi:hypothetical protein